MSKFFKLKALMFGVFVIFNMSLLSSEYEPHRNCSPHGWDYNNHGAIILKEFAPSGFSRIQNERLICSEVINIEGNCFLNDGMLVGADILIKTE